MSNHIENIFYNIDIFNIIFDLLPIYNQLFMFKISKFYLNYSKRIKCNYCNNKICCPIINNNKIYCLVCLNLKLNIKYSITNVDKKFWTNCEKIEKKYVYCKYCNLKCCSLEFLHYHINFKCKNN